MSSNFYELACQLVQAGISVLPIAPANGDEGKKPALGSWMAYKTRLPEVAELASWFKGFACRGIGAIGGAVSGNLECIDFDEPGLFDEWAIGVDRMASGLLDRCVLVKTPKVGMHVWYRCTGVEGSQLLAKRPPTAEELAENPKKQFVKRIETRGTGGYALVPGSARECHPFRMPYLYAERGLRDLCSVQEISTDERDIMISLARSYSTLADEAPIGEHRILSTKGSGGLSIGDDYEARSSWQDILEPLGWHIQSGEWESGRLCRPGKRNGVSATVGYCRGKSGEPLLHVFSTDAGIDCGTYGKFRAYAKLNHGGDYKAAAAALGHRGFGMKSSTNGQPMASAQPTQPSPKPWTVKPNVAPPTGGISAAELVKLTLPPPQYAIGGLLCEGLTILGGRPKQGKSWMALLMAWAVAAGEALDGRQVAGGEVLYLALEDTPRRLQQRLQMLRPAAWTFPERLTIHTQWQRADQGGLYFLNEWLAGGPQRRFVVIDTLARFRKPIKGTGNNYAEDYEALADVKALLDSYGASGLLIHHTRKLQAEDPFDELSGTMAISGAADGLMVLDRKRGESTGRLFVTGRDVPDATVPLTIDRATFRWTLGEPQEGINTDGRHVSPASNRVDQCCVWLREFLREFAYPSAEIDAAAKAAGFSFSAIKEAKAKLGRGGTGEVTNRNYGGQGKNDWWSGLGPADQWIKRPVDNMPASGGQDIPD